jgi:hypothetical protein
MNIRKLFAIVPLAVVGGTMLYSGRYFFLYLDRWEWNRAIVSGIVFLAAEIGLFGALILSRLGRPRTTDPVPAASNGSTGRNGRGAPDERVLSRIREAAPPPRRTFAWLDPSRSNVFIPILLGAGVVASGVAWLVERLARLTFGRRLERDLAHRLAPFALPETLVPARTEPHLELFAPLTRNRTA